MESKCAKAFIKIFILSLSKHFKGAYLLKFKVCSILKVKFARLTLNTGVEVCSDPWGFV